MSKKRRRRNLMTLWRGKVARVIGQGSDTEVMLLARLVMHRGLTHEQKYLVLEGAIFDVWGERLAAREEERRARRKRNREQARQERQFREPASGPGDAVAQSIEPVAGSILEPIPLDPAGSAWTDPTAPEH